MSEVKLCIHTKLNGKQCRGIALTGKSYCRFHNRYYERRCVTTPDYEPPVFEDSRSIMMGIHELVRSRMQGKVDNRDLTSYMYAYQVAASMMRRPDAMAPDAEEDFESRETEKANARTSRRKAPKEEEEEEPEEGTSLAEILGAEFARQGVPVDFHADDHLPEDLRRSKSQIFLDALKAQKEKFAREQQMLEDQQLSNGNLSPDLRVS